MINPGSAVRGTLADLRTCGATPVAIGTLAVLGGAAARLAADYGVPLVTFASPSSALWTPAECPLTALGASRSSPGPDLADPLPHPITAVYEADHPASAVYCLAVPTAYDAKGFNTTMPEGTKMALQERAYTSPIWYSAAK